MPDIKKIIVSAPASTMLMGEHSVLFEHRAIVCAVDQRITIELTPRSDDQIYIYSELANHHSTLTEIITNNVQIDTLKFVLACIRAVQPKKGFSLHITSAFSHTVGLGSSACVTASCVYALLLYKNNHAHFDTVFDIGLKVIHSVQKRGSGSDLVASVYGGMLGYTVNPKEITQLLQPERLNTHDLPTIHLYYSGYKTPTPTVLAQVEEQAKQFPHIYKNIYQQMHDVTVQAETFIEQQDWQALGKLMNVYHGLMCAIGVSDMTLSHLVYTARSQPQILGAKISGSGLGDCIITVTEANAESTTHTDLLPHLLTQAHISPQGLLRHE